MNKALKARLESYPKYDIEIEGEVVDTVLIIHLVPSKYHLLQGMIGVETDKMPIGELLELLGPVLPDIAYECVRQNNNKASRYFASVAEAELTLDQNQLMDVMNHIMPMPLAEAEENVESNFLDEKS